MALKKRLQKAWDQFYDKGLNYWIIVAFLIPIGMLLGDLLGEQKVWVTTRYHIYQTLGSVSTHSLNYSTRTVVILIGDEEYWKGELARRTPLKRTYLAEILRKLDMANPAVIALDVDLRSQTPDKSIVEHPDYHTETDTLFKAIDAVSRNRYVILPKTLISEGGTEGSLLSPHGKEEYILEPSIYDDLYDGFNFETQFLRTGYVSLPYDIRQVPLTLKLKDGSSIDSFAAAIARTIDERAIESAQARDEDALPYGKFIPPQEFEQFSAKYVLDTKPEILKSKLAAKVVLVGGAWHEHAFGRGKQVDTHLSPVGDIGGVFVHANYVEALLTHRTYRPFGKNLGVIIEVLVSILIALIFAYDMKPWKKLAWAAGLSLILILITYVAWQNLGLFFDFFIPLILLGGHIVIERVLEWRTEAKEYARKLKEKEVEACAEL